MFKYSLLALSVFSLSACGTTSFGDKVRNKTEIRVVDGVVYPQLPNIPLPPNPGYTPVTFDYPRDKTKGKIVKNIPACESVPAEKRDQEFLDKCTVHPVDKNSNLYIGLSLEDWKNFLINQSKSDVLIEQYRKRLEEVNKEREDWRNVSPKN